MDTNTKSLGLFPAHPSQLWMMHALVNELPSWITPIWVLRSKDCMENLAKELKIEPVARFKAGKGLIRNALELVQSTLYMLYLSNKLNIDCWYSKYGAVNVSACLAKIPNISFNDDDYDMVPLLAWTSYPFATKILCPNSIRMGRFDKKTIRYNSFHELYYLHPNRFKPKPQNLHALNIDENSKYCIVRLSALDAHHDLGIQGMHWSVVDKLIEILPKDYRIYISSEKELPEKYARFQLKIPEHMIHHVLSFAQMLVGDSQTMTSEAAVLGVPAYRLSDFVGRLSNIEELESAGLCYGYLPKDSEQMLSDISNNLRNDDLKKIHEKRRQDLLDRTIDPVPFLANLIVEQLKKIQ